MMRRWFKTLVAVSFCIGVLSLVLFGNFALSFSNLPWQQSLAREIQAACRDPGTQWMVVTCLLSYFIVFVVLEAKSKAQSLRSKVAPESETSSLKSEVADQETECPTSNAKLSTSKETETRHLTSIPHPQPLSHPLGEGGIGLSPDEVERGKVFAFLAFFRGQVGNPDFWLAGFVLLVLLRYALDYSNAAKSLQVVVLLTGIVIGKGIALWVAWSSSLKSKVQIPKSGAAETRHLTPALSPIEAERESPPSSIFYLLSSSRSVAILSILVLLLAVASLWHPERGMEFFYRGQPRWTGPWDNPNLFGVLMGAGTALAVGLLVSGFRFKVSSCQSVISCGSCISRLKILFPILLFLAAGACAFGLLKSYSRGAWLGTACGLGFLLWKWVNREPREKPTLHKPSTLNSQPSTFRLWFPSSILILSLFVICFWQFRHTESPLARRLFSVGNVNDFSWRNRVTAWQGAGRMMWDKPFVGFGWSKAEEIYSKQYRAARLEESAAIQVNDYLMLGISVGVPALGCLLVYLGLVLRRGAVGRGGPLPAVGDTSSGGATYSLSAAEKDGGAHGVPLPTINLQLSTVAAAGAIVLLIGFWFDGGLFKLPTAVVFWVLIELVRISALPTSGHPLPARRGEGSESTANNAKHAKSEIGLRWLAGGFAAVALGLTGLHLITPQLMVSERTLTMARRFLVPAQEQSDFEYLAAKPIWANQPLRVLLQHAHLANYNRTLVNWKLSDELYREFVLTPEISEPSTISSQPSTDLDWRRPLWEFFYPRIRKENSLEAAVEIVMRHLRERVKVVNEVKASTSILESWQRGAADAATFQKLVVAALRSGGIPARLTAPGQAEFWNGVEWKSAK